MSHADTAEITARTPESFLSSGHLPTLIACLLYFDVSFMVWVLLGPLAPFLSEDLKLTAAQKGLVVAVPLLGGALFRPIMGVLGDLLGGRRAGMLGLGLTLLPLLLGWRFARHLYDFYGVGILLGWKRIDVPGATGYLDTNYAAKGSHGVAALENHDLVCVHIEAPDEASHEGKADAKVKALEEIDRHIVGPLLQALPRYKKWRILVSPDHRTTLRTRAHAHGPVPVAIAGTGIISQGQPSYDEAVAGSSALAFEKGHNLMPHFLG